MSNIALGIEYDDYALAKARGEIDPKTGQLRSYIPGKQVKSNDDASPQSTYHDKNDDENDYKE